MQRCLLSIMLSLPSIGQTIYSDEPLEFELPPVAVDRAAVRKLSDYYDAVSHTLHTPGELNRSRSKPVRSQAVSTLGEPLQGAWWTKRH